jgi:uncharacterized phage infection (PIP) family protein YhgE
MTIAKTLASVQRSKQFQNLLNSGLKLVSTDRQLQNGTLAFTGKLKAGRKTIRPTYAVTSTGAVISNEFVARRVACAKQTDQYRQGLTAVSEILGKRLAA